MTECMGKKFSEYKNFDLVHISKEILSKWKEESPFDESIGNRKNAPGFIFYEGPPSANGMPGIHHVMARTIKDIFCRYKTLKGFQVHRKAGWDTHGLPVELGVEEKLGITKEDIGKSISVESYNEECRKEVMKYTDAWKELTEQMGYWVDMDNPYITYDNQYIESVWYLLKQFFSKGLLYKGYSIQPYSPAAGTGLSTHELNQPGCYKDVKDTSCVAQFRIIKDEKSAAFFQDAETDLFLLAWTTTPWTLPSNTALCVGPEIEYVKVQSFNPYTGIPITVILAKDLLHTYFSDKLSDLSLSDYKDGDKDIPYRILASFKGKDLEGLLYEQLLPWVTPEKGAFRVVSSDFVSTEEGTGIVHIAPTFGADDYRVAQENNIPPLTILEKEGIHMPLVDKKGRFVPIDHMDDIFLKEHVNTDAYTPFASRYVKNAFDENLSDKDPSIDIDICVDLKKQNKAFRIEKYVHNYPHCWRTDKPVLYYPLDSWFIRTTQEKEKLIRLNKQINWKPESTGTGRFGKWLENLVDWNLSRSRYWGTPLPVWATEEKDEYKCIGSVAELKEEISKSVAAGFMKNNPLEHFSPNDFSKENYTSFDLHRPHVDEIFLVSEKGKKMIREADLIDVWFDSGSMPYAQLHYPFENTDVFEKKFPADFIAEGVDQTRGWFFTLHAIAGMLFDSVAFKNIISNGLVLDKKGNKMSKRLGNAVDPFQTMDRYGPDPLRWYMITNAAPWDNLKFDVEGVDEVKRKFFGTLYNTYAFFSLYANIDGFTGEEAEVPVERRPEIDRWIMSLLNSLIKEVETHYEQYEPTKAGRAIQHFVTENLSNWYVRLNRKRYWGGEYNQDKLAAYQTLFTCLKVVSLLSSPIAPFYMDKLFRDLHITETRSSVHLENFPTYNDASIDKQLEDQMAIAQQICSMILSLRRKVSIKVRQPLGKIMIPLPDKQFKAQLDAVKDLILNEVNVKEIEYVSDTTGILVKKIKPDFKKLGPRYGKKMKQLAGLINNMSQEEIAQIEEEGRFLFTIDGDSYEITLDDVEIINQDIPGWLVLNEGKITVALDITITEALQQEGIARELVNRIQNIRKESSFDVTDKINIKIENHAAIGNAIKNFGDYIKNQTLAETLDTTEKIEGNNSALLELNDISLRMTVSKSNSINL